MSAGAPSGVEFLWFLQDPCNYRCPYCVVSGGRREKRPWLVNTRPAAGWVAAWDRVFERHGSCWIHLTGGEPTTLPGFLELVAGMVRLHRVAFDTNMSWSVESLRRFAALVPPERTNIDVSVHPTETDPAVVRDKAAWLKERGYKLICRVVGWPPLLPEVPRLRRLFEEAGLRFIVNPYQGDWEGKEYPRDYDAAQRRMLGEAAAGLDGSRAEDAEQMVIADHILHMHERSPRGRLCNSGHRYARVMHDGAVYRCQPYESRGWEPLGNLLDPDFRLRPGPAPCRSDSCEFEIRYLVPEATEAPR